jgi:PAS domain S-box-containing protein
LQSRHSLSEREREILELSCDGYTDCGIANKLSISKGTVNTYWGRIRAKLGSRSRPELIALWIRDKMQSQITLIGVERDRLAEQLNSQTEEATDYQDLVNESSFGILLVDDREQILLANPAANLLLGYAYPSLQGRQLLDLYPDRMRDFQRSRLTSATPNHHHAIPTSLHSHSLMLHASGREIPATSTIVRYEHHGHILTSIFLEPLRSDAELFVHPEPLFDPKGEISADAGLERPAGRASLI